MKDLQVLTTQEPTQWMHVLDRCAPYDFYHLPQYHVLAEEAGEGSAHLFVFTQGAYTIAMPLLLREVEANWKDANSVYGYAGPVCSHRSLPDAVVGNFQSALTERLRDLGVVNVFSRLHPLFTQRPLLAGLGEYRLSRTVSIDLTLEPALQRSKFRKAFKEGINKLRRYGLTVFHDVDGIYLDDFSRIYDETMQRVEAAGRYLFSPAYFHQFWETLGPRAHLFVCLQNGRPLCGGLFMECHGIIQYHLGGTLNAALKLAPMKLLVDDVRLWGNAQGCRALHLGGGTSSDPDDSLLHFKMGFSDTTLEFATWRWVLSPEVYDRLCAAKAQSNELHRFQVATPDFFPAYRSPTMPILLTSPASPATETLLEPRGSIAGRRP